MVSLRESSLPQHNWTLSTSSILSTQLWGKIICPCKTSLVVWAIVVAVTATSHSHVKIKATDRAPGPRGDSSDASALTESQRSSSSDVSSALSASVCEPGLGHPTVLSRFCEQNDSASVDSSTLPHPPFRCALRSQGWAGTITAQIQN